MNPQKETEGKMNRRKMDSGFYQIVFHYGIPILTALFIIWLTSINTQMNKQSEDISILRLQVTEFKGFSTQLLDLKDFVKEVRAQQILREGRLASIEQKLENISLRISDLKTGQNRFEEQIEKLNDSRK
jgi:hypothetical protein